MLDILSARESGRIRSTATTAPRYSATLDAPLRGVILAGAFSWGDSFLTGGLRSPLAPMGLEPLICQSLRWLRAAGIANVTVCAHRGIEEMAAHLGGEDGADGTLQFLEDESPRGAAGCAYDAMRQTDARRLIVVESGLLPQVDVAALLDAHVASGALATVVVEIDRRASGPGARVPQPGGIYVFERAALEHVKPTGYQDIKEGLLEQLFRAGVPVHTFAMQGLAPRVLDLTTYVAANRLVATRLARGLVPLPPGFLRDGEIVRHHSSVVSPRVCAIGPLLLGPGVVVGDDVVLVGPAAVGANTHVERGATLSRSIVWDHGRIGAGALVDDSLLGRYAVVRPGEQLHGDLRSPARSPDLSTPVRPAPVRPMRAPAPWLQPVDITSRLAPDAGRRAGLRPSRAS